jgi:uncharacterized protein (TIGR03083 family)
MLATMETEEHIAALQRDGELLALAAERAGLDAAVPPCPPWRVRDLLRHLGYVHRWAAGFVSERRQRPPDDPAESELLRGGPPDAGLVGWFRDGHAALVRTLRTADPGLSCWTVLPGPSCVASWARRQAHETAIHRADAELADGKLTMPPAEFAADGIDELIMGFFARDQAKLTDAQRTAEHPTLQVRTTDTGDDWLVELIADGSLAASVRRGGWPADAALAGPAAGLYLLLWNRCGPADCGVTVTGDAEVLASWQHGMRVTWS